MNANYQDATMMDPVLRRALGDARQRIFRRARRERIAAKRAFLEI